MLHRRGFVGLHLMLAFPPLYRAATIGACELQDLPYSAMGFGVLPIKLTTLLVDLYAFRQKREGF